MIKVSAAAGSGFAEVSAPAHHHRGLVVRPVAAVFVVAADHLDCLAEEDGFDFAVRLALALEVFDLDLVAWALFAVRHYGLLAAAVAGFFVGRGDGGRSFPGCEG